MKVQCIKIINPITRKEENISNWLTLGKDYLVIEIFITLEKKVLFRCLSDDNNTPIMVENTQFKVICGKIPLTWEIKMDASGNLYFAPKAWHKRGFWEDYFNGETNAVETFEYEISQIDKST